MLQDIDEHLRAVRALRDSLAQQITAAAEMIVECLRGGSKLLLCGNGGSAADAQHIAAEFVGRFLAERDGFPAIALTTDTSALTALSNDYGFDRVFSRQVQALGRRGDVLIAISTSGNSPNVIEAVDAARIAGVRCIGLLGRDGGRLSNMVDLSVIVPANETARIQECHGLIGHLLCASADRALTSQRPT
jgi:phosphoheptose isomerase